MLHKILVMGLMFMSGSVIAEVQKAAYGTAKTGEAVEMYTLRSASVQVQVITYGARITSIEAADRTGKRENIALGFSTLAGYEADTSYFGSLVGRYANRLAKGQFTIAGKVYQVPTNNGPNALHGGPLSFAQKVWTAHDVAGGVEMSLVSPAGEMGFPGTLTTHVRYTLQGASLHIDIRATTDAETVVNLTNHSYFNLSGEGNGTIVHDRIRLDSDEFVPADATQLPTGKLTPVAGTPFDFRTAHVIGDRIDTAGNEQLSGAGGYDHTWVVRGKAGTLREAAMAIDPHSGRTLTVATTQPGVQFYTGNSLKGSNVGPGGRSYVRRGGFCLETQHYPDSPNQPQFPSTLLKPGQTFHETTVFTFGVEK